MYSRRVLLRATALAAACLLAQPALESIAGNRDNEYSLSPRQPQTGKRWRLGYYEGGQYPDYEVILKATVRGLIKLGWMEPMQMSLQNDGQPGGFWRYLAATAKSKHIEFVGDAFYTAGNFDPAVRPQVRAKLLNRLSDRRDVDLMIAMGTWAGQDLANNQHRVPTVVESTSDPIGAGIVPSATDSGLDHLHAKVELGRYQRQVELFHDIFHFRKLGLVYEDSREGRTFAGVDAVEEVARARGFEIVRCNTPFNGVSRKEAEDGVVRCYERIAEQSDAVYITVHQGVTLANMENVLKPLIAKRIPTFSMLGSNEVKRGVLLSVAQANFTYVGQFHAETIARIFNGAKPRDLEQRWVSPAKVAVNLKTAELIGFKPPADIMLAADEIYAAIEGSPAPPTD